MADYLTDYKSRSSNVKAELSLRNYATKEDLKNITHLDTSSFSLKTNLYSLKTEVQEDFTKKTDKNETGNDNLEIKVNK